jgi:hypothetical protein
MSDVESVTKESIATPSLHLLHHVQNIEEHEELWRELRAQQKQIDDLYKLVLRLLRATLQP